MRLVGRLIVAGFVVLVVLQFFRPAIPAKPAAAEVQAPAEVRQVLRNRCFSCHSDERRLAWFDQIVPAYWLVRHDVLTAREQLNFSTLGAKPAAVQRATLFEAVNMMQLGAMPLTRFTALHPDARVSPEDLATLKAYLAPWSPAPAPPSGPAGASAPSLVSLGEVKPELNGLAFEPQFEGWQLISTTDRGDNNTLRFILGNDVAFNAARMGDISPWPDGTRFAKIAWGQQRAADGLVYPGSFVQVELMVKDAARYKSTDGWGWGRWRGLDLKPYGADARFVGECTTCHMPMRGNDAVYTLPITQASVGRAEAVNHRAATLPASLPYQPLAWRVITLFVDPKSRATSVLFGNDAAMDSVHARGAAAEAAPAYTPRAVLALVTWAQRDDPHWFGARIPDAPQSVEFVEVTAAGQAGRYRRFAGAGLGEDLQAPAVGVQRMSLILGLPPAVLP
jgi:mono/diheme cytochrome c family protein